jgi:hypothetical protein
METTQPIIKTAVLRLDLPLKPRESECLRGAVIHQLAGAENILLHNHLDDSGGLRYAYPLVQYKVLEQKGAIVAIGEGTKELSTLMACSELNVRVGTHTHAVGVKSVAFDDFRPEFSEKGFRYRLDRWQPLNSENFRTYGQLLPLTDKIIFLEKILTGHILSLYKGLGIFINREVQCCFTRLSDPYEDRYKGFNTQLFQAEILTNISLPLCAGLGKGSSLGYGTILEL